MKNNLVIVISILMLSILTSCGRDNKAELKNSSDSDKTKTKITVNNDTTIEMKISSKTVLNNAFILISKSKRRLSVYSDSILVGNYKVSLGTDPVSDKIKAGDDATPEGDFYICNKNPKSRFHLSLLISYPNKEDAERGLKDGLITESQYREIIMANEKGTTPPQNTKLGSNICIHGGGLLWADWTAGCIALENENIEDIFRVIPIGTKVRIEK